MSALFNLLINSKKDGIHLVNDHSLSHLLLLKTFHLAESDHFWMKYSSSFHLSSWPLATYQSKDPLHQAGWVEEVHSLKL